MAEPSRPIDAAATLALEIHARSAKGSRSDNQDDTRHAVHAGHAYAVLADGAGGHEGGAIASDLVVRLLALRLQAGPVPSPLDLTQQIDEAHQALCERQQGRGRRGRMHTTVVLLSIDRSCMQALWSHVGDSRLYLLRRGRVLHVTRDDSVVRQMLDAGYLSEAEAAVHPQRHHLIAAMGIEAALTPHTLAQAWPLHDGDALLLCSDGWWEDLGEAAIEDTLAKAISAEDWLDGMECHILAAARPDQDNYSAVAVWVGDPRSVTRLGP